jgi:hypothetical protein
MSLLTNSMTVAISALAVSPAHVLPGLGNTNAKAAGGGKKPLKKNVAYTRSISISSAI